MKYQTLFHPHFLVIGPTISNPRAAVIEPDPFMMPVTVPKDLLLPDIEGCSDKSTATVCGDKRAAGKNNGR